MKTEIPTAPAVDLSTLRQAIRDEYDAVARKPGQGFHFHTGRPLAAILGYGAERLRGIPEAAVESFAGTGNPFTVAGLKEGERVVDVGSGAGIDSLIAAREVGGGGEVVGVEMTEAMREKAERARREAGADNVEFRNGYGESLPVEDGWADVVISNGVFNLMPDKSRALDEMSRVLKPGGRLAVADILVDKPVSPKAKERIDLWTG